METFVYFVTFTILLFMIFLFQRFKYYQLFSKNDIPGPLPNLFTGNLRSVRNSNKTMMETMTEWENIYGPIYGYFMGTRPVVVIRNLESIKTIFIKNFSIASNRPKMIVSTNPIIHTLVGLRGQRWKEVRQVLNPTFSGSKMRQMISLIGGSVQVTLDMLEEFQGREFDAYYFFQGLTCQVIAECALAMKVNCQRNPKDKLLLAIRSFLENAMSPVITFALCFPAFVKILGYIAEKFSVSGQMTDIICDNVRRVIKVRQGNEEHIDSLHHVDVLQLMLDSQRNLVNSPKCLSEDEIIANSWVFVLGGFETTAAALSFTAYLLALNQDIQEKLFLELERAFPDDQTPTYEDVNNLVYLDMVISESLRLFPPVVTFVTRELEEATVVDSKVVPAGVTVQVPVWNIHHDPELWPDPYKFDPERFHPSNKNNIHPLSWIPFGIGPRNCIGMRFALMETKLTLAKIIRLFRLLPTDKTDRNLQLKVPTVTLVPKDGISLRCQKR